MVLVREYEKDILYEPEIIQVAEGEGIGSLFNLIASNADKISQVGKAAGSVASAVSSGVNAVNSIRALANARKMREAAATPTQINVKTKDMTKEKRDLSDELKMEISKNVLSPEKKAEYTKLLSGSGLKKF